MQVSEPLQLDPLVYNVLFLAYSADVLWLVALSSMFSAVTWIFYEWVQHHALCKHHDQAMTFQWNLLHGLRAYARLVKWFPLASIFDSKPVSHVCYCQNHNNRKSDFSKLCIKSARKVICCCKIVVVNWFIKTASQDSMYLFRGKIYSNICLEIWV